MTSLVSNCFFLCVGWLIYTARLCICTRLSANFSKNCFFFKSNLFNNVFISVLFLVICKKFHILQVWPYRPNSAFPYENVLCVWHISFALVLGLFINMVAAMRLVGKSIKTKQTITTYCWRVMFSVWNAGNN